MALVDVIMHTARIFHCLISVIVFLFLAYELRLLYGMIRGQRLKLLCNVIMLSFVLIFGLGYRLSLMGKRIIHDASIFTHGFC